MGLSRRIFGISKHLDIWRWLRQSPGQVRDKPICVALTELSQRQCTGKVRKLFCRHKSQMSTDFIAKSAWWKLDLTHQTADWNRNSEKCTKKSGVLAEGSLQTFQNLFSHLPDFVRESTNHTIDDILQTTETAKCLKLKTEKMTNYRVHI